MRDTANQVKHDILNTTYTNDMHRLEQTLRNTELGREIVKLLQTNPFPKIKGVSPDVFEVIKPIINNAPGDVVSAVNKLMETNPFGTR